MCLQSCDHYYARIAAGEHCASPSLMHPKLNLLWLLQGIPQPSIKDTELPDVVLWHRQYELHSVAGKAP
jgi:hypothetical protein